MSEIKENSGALTPDQKEVLNSINKNSKNQPLSQNNSDNNKKDELTNYKTYFLFSDKNSGCSLELDLVTFREKGEETRYLSFLLNGIDTSQSPPVPQSSRLTIESKEEFEKIKNFFAQLNWED